MHVIVATDGSKQSLAAARHLKSFADPTKITEISVIAVIRPLAAVAFADDLSNVDQRKAHADAGSFRAAAENAVDVVAGEFDGWERPTPIARRDSSSCVPHSHRIRRCAMRSSRA